MIETKRSASHLAIATALAFVIAPTHARAESPASQLGTWHFNARESDQGKNPNPVVQAVLDVSADDGKMLRFTLVENMKDGSKLTYNWDGAYDGILRAAADFYSVGYTHTPNGWHDSWELTSGPAKGMKGFDDCSLSTDAKKQTCHGGIAGSPPGYTLVYDKVAN